MINLYICDDHRMVVESLKKMINKSQIANITQAYVNISSCTEGLIHQLPDILLLDIDLPDGDGVNFCKKLHSQYPTLKIIMLTTFNELSIAKRAYTNGASGYIVKNDSLKNLMSAITKVYSGELAFSDEFLKNLHKDQITDVVWLTNRETEILQYIANGYSSKEIAQLINRELDTVKSIKKNIYVKLNVHNSANAVKVAIKQRLISLK